MLITIIFIIMLVGDVFRSPCSMHAAYHSHNNIYYSLVSNNVRGRTYISACVRSCVCACVRDVFAIYDNNII